MKGKEKNEYSDSKETSLINSIGLLSRTGVKSIGKKTGKIVSSQINKINDTGNISNNDTLENDALDYNNDTLDNIIDNDNLGNDK